MAKKISQEALRSRYLRNRRAAAHAYIAIAKKQKQAVPERILQIVGEHEHNSSVQRSHEDRSA